MEQQKLESMVSQHCYDEICAKLKEQVGEEAFDYAEAVKIAKEELESFPFEEGDSDGLCFD